MIFKKNVSPRFNRLFACFIVLVFLVIVQLMAKDTTSTSADSRTAGESGELEQATLGAGCFWCVEAVFETLDGVESVVSGYMGGETLNPTYESICTGLTGHAEVVQIHFKPEVISYEALLKRFWLAHDPTTLNRQGADVGTQYRSAIFWKHLAPRRAGVAAARDAVRPRQVLRRNRPDSGRARKSTCPGLARWMPRSISAPMRYSTKAIGSTSRRSSPP